jgi:uncharacterized protein YndB with AHSA1/START domain/DNA-binding transcriptional ArsR family regulator
VEAVFRALADPSRRLLLDRLFERDGQTLEALCGHLPEMTRFGVMKHLRVLADADLVTSRRVGREKLHYLNPVPIRLLHDRWISKYAEQWVEAMSGLKRILEEQPMSHPVHVYEMYIRTTPERLWQAITSPEMSRQYYYGTSIESSLRAGDPIRYRNAAGAQILDGTIVEVEPPRRLVQTFVMTHNAEAAADRPSRVTWLIEPRGEVCKLTLTHDDFDGETATYRAVEFGWNPILSGLKTLLETGEPLKLGAA